MNSLLRLPFCFVFFIVWNAEFYRLGFCKTATGNNSGRYIGQVLIQSIASFALIPLTLFFIIILFYLFIIIVIIFVLGN